MRNSGLTAAAALALIAIGMPLAPAAPTPAPPSDSEGYLDSTARCPKPDTAVLFGATKSSRVAICETATGAYEYRGVRVSDGAKLIVPAKQTSNTTFGMANDGVKYTVTPTALSITAGGNTFRTEAWTDFHSKLSPDPSASPSAKQSILAPVTKSAASPPLSATPLPPPMAAEVGGGSPSGE